MEVDIICSKVTQQAIVLGKLNLDIYRDPLLRRTLFKDVHESIKKQNKLCKVKTLCIPTDDWNQQDDDDILSTICLYTNLTNCLLKGRVLGFRVHSGLKYLPTNFSLSTSLTNLDFSFNNLKEIPKQVDCLKFLKVLSLNFNFIGEINFDLFPSSIEEIYVSNNGAEIIRGCCERLKMLRIINLSSNKLEKLPANFLRSPKMCDILLQENLIKEFPLSVLKNESIRNVNLSHNCLCKLLSVYLIHQKFLRRIFNETL